MKKSQIIALVVLVVLLGLCVAGYFVGKQYFADKEKKEEASKKTTVLKINPDKVIGVAYSYNGKTYTLQNGKYVNKSAQKNQAPDRNRVLERKISVC